VPSRYEGFGYALAEALCAGLPAIAARSSSLIEVADASTVLLPPDDPSAWVEGIAALLADRDAAERRAVSARGAAVSRFAWSTAATATIAIYRRIANGQ
jgi:glycosyltransferase involved in cell wall biosynthesis